MIFELFANYSQNDARAVRRDLVEYSRTMRMDVGTSCHTAMRLKGFTNLDEWINHVEKPDSPGDEFVLYILGKMYYRHVIVMTGQNIWCTVENHHNMSIQDLLEVCSVHLVYLGKHQYGVIKRKNVNIEPLNVQQIRQRRQNPVPAMYNCSYNYSRAQSRPLNLTTRGTGRGRGSVGTGRGNHNYSYNRGGRLIQSHQRINPVSVLGRGTAQPLPIQTNPGFTISSVFVSANGPATVSNRTNATHAYKHPEVAQVVQGLLNRENIQPSVNRDSYKHPEVEEVVSRLLSKRNTTALVDLTNEVETDIANKDTPSSKTNVVVNLSHSESSLDIDKNATEYNNVIQTETSECSRTNQDKDKQSTSEMLSADELINSNQKTVPDTPKVCNITLDGSNDAISENNSVNLNDVNQTTDLVVEKDNKKAGKEIGELLSSDDCSTSNTTDELLEELGINERCTQPQPLPEPTPEPEINNSSGNLTDKSVDESIPAVSGKVAVQDETDKLDERNTNKTTSKNDEQDTTIDLPTPQVNATASTSENKSNKALSTRSDLLVKTELDDDDMPGITDCSKLKSNELEENTQFTFHLLQEQIQQLQCKIETKELTTVNQIKVSPGQTADNPVYVRNDVNTDKDNDSPFIKTESGNETNHGDGNKHDSDTSTLNVTGLQKRKRTQRIESESGSDSDNIPLSVLKRKMSTKPTDRTGTVETLQKPKKHKTTFGTKRKKMKRQFTTKPPPSQSAKPTVKRKANAPDEIPNQESETMDSETDPCDDDNSERSNDTDTTGQNTSTSNNDADQLDNPIATTSKTNTIKPRIKSSATSGNNGSNSASTSSTKRKRKRNFYCTAKNCTTIKPTLKELNDHFRSSHDFAHCPECGKPFPTPSAVAKHMYQHRTVLLQCDQCSKAYPFESQLIQHKISHEEEGQYQCTKCPKTIKNKSDFKKHMKAHEEITLDCKFCDTYTATDIRNLKSHLKTHDGLMRYVCKFCGKHFKHYNQRRRHIVDLKCPKLAR